ncbi:MAG: DcrB-related protein [Geobacteraceae bacterium]|nr:DcrB-related protein [Geobacteraceae bacterium]
MITYRMQEGEIVIPDSWSDQSINIFKIPADGKTSEASFVVSRDASQGDKLFSDYVAGQMDAASRQLQGFKLLQHEDFMLSGHAAAAVRYQWSSNGRDLTLFQVFVEHKPSVVVLTLTTTPDDAENHRELWKEVIKSFRPFPSAGPSREHETSP